MFESIKSKLGVALAAALGILAIALGIERKKRADAEAKLESAEFDKNDAVLAERQQAKAAEVMRVIADAEEEKGRKLTSEEMEEYLRKL